MAMKQGNLLGMIQQSARNGTLLSSCEPEVRELMHQIDVLISGKQAEWAGKWAGLETQLREKERELAAVRHTLWEKDTEVEQLRQQVTSVQDERPSSQYDTQSLQLKTELDRMTEKYEQLKARRRKHSNTQSVSARKCTEEIQQLREDTQTLERARVELERDKSVLEGQLNVAQLESTTLQEKCAALEGEVKFCRSQLDQKDSLVAAIEQSSAVRAKQLEAQLKRTQELADSRETTLHKIHRENEERKREAESATAQSQSLNSQLSHSQSAVRQLKTKFAELQLQLKKAEDQLKVTESQLSQRDQSVKLLQQSSQRKDDLIRSLGGRQAQGSELSRLKQELSHAHSQLQSQIQQEKGLRDEMTKLKHRNATSRQELAKLTAECASKDQKFAEELAVLTHRHSTELKELKSQLLKLREEKTLALEQKERECEGRLAASERQVKLLEDRLRSSLTGRDVNTASRTTATHLSAPTHYSEHVSSPPHTTAQSTPSHSTSTQPPLSLPTTTTSNILQRFLAEAATIAHHIPHSRGQSHNNPPIQSQHCGSATQQHSGEFFPLQPVHGRDDRPELRVDDSITEDVTGEVRKSGVGREGDGVVVERGGVSQLEDVFSKTLDSIVDRHFQQLDSSLKKLMNKQT